MNKRDDEERFVLVRYNQLPEVIQKTLEAKRLIESGEVDTVQQAVAKLGLSRSSYYKYRDSIFPFQSLNHSKMVTLVFLLKDQAGVLSHVLSFLAGTGVNILTIHQTIPLQGEASVSMSVDLTNLASDLEDLVDRLRGLKGVQRVTVIGVE
ncbi:ACT domain-containing protein [Thermoactinomyces sp. DSM 45892]|uniref:ACT domain-containing protein n=1 Tax=Thermoactinomyces sp. DSM 45892 TaxID=1882753 RepID=UPI00089770D1|nr:ACT domain-containing protein [Thermoactinomyces sp. DSM 45892]SDY04760.1 chorismate mutase [Thermoactinomyces sp. DSM 45892]